MIKHERLKELFHYDPETGDFIWLVSRGRARSGSGAGRLMHDGYWQISIDGRQYLAHRLAWFYMTGEWPQDHIDHINGVRDDNRFCNLRGATVAENGQNRKINSNNSSGFTGVCWSSSTRKWQARIGINKRNKHLGLFDTPEAAHTAYVAAKAETHTFQPTIRALGGANVLNQ